MDQTLRMNGKLSDTNIIEIFSNVIKSEFNDCNLTLLNNGSIKTIYIKNNRIIFIYSEDNVSTLYEYLKLNSGLLESDLEKAKAVSEKKGLRLGKSLIELNLINYNDLWTYITSHQNQLLEDICTAVTGEFSIGEFSADMTENITLDTPLSFLILNLIRDRDYSQLIKRKFEMVEKVFLRTGIRNCRKIYSLMKNIY